MHVSATCLDEWLADWDIFRVDFLDHCYAISKSVGYYPDVNFPALQEAHRTWVERCREWSDNFVMASDGLSHFKLMSILLVQLVWADWINDLHDYVLGEREPEYAGTEEERVESRKDLNAGRGAFLGFQFVMNVLSAFEAARLDRVQPFELRLTLDFEHDFMVFLLAERDRAKTLFLFEMSTYLILTALYLRDPKP
jgi:hypothetical protein